MKYFFALTGLLFTILFLSSASCDKFPPEPKPQPEPVAAGFARGADVSWLTQMEKEGCKFYKTDGTQSECMALLKGYGIDAIRLRVMIDFHYSDWWADPGKQNKPEAWKSLDFEGLKKAVADHTTDVLNALKAAGVTPEWTQIGNETTGGMLWPDGQNYTDAGFVSYVQLHNAGYDAAKAVFPQAKALVHVDNGWKWETLDWFFKNFKIKGGKCDLIGLSLYPEKSNWQQYNLQICENIKKLYDAYGKETIICEVGMEWTEAETCRSFLNDLIGRTKNTEQSHCTGVLYWEPEGYHAWSGYSKCAFDNSGKPTVAMEGFMN